MEMGKKILRGWGYTIVLLISAASFAPPPSWAAGKAMNSDEKEFPEPLLDAGKKDGYCDPNFYQGEALRAHPERVTTPDSNSRVIRIQIGQVVLYGSPVGNDSSGKRSLAIAAKNNVGAEAKYCTFYVSGGNDKPGELFIQRSLLNQDPRTILDRKINGRPITDEEVGSIYYGVVGKTFYQDNASGRPEYEPSMLSCLRDYRFLNVGCDGMKHRGPTVFAMLLSFSGCAPWRSAVIANLLWDSNGVPFQVRYDAASTAWKQGQGPLADFQARAASIQLQAYFSEI